MQSQHDDVHALRPSRAERFDSALLALFLATFAVSGCGPRSMGDGDAGPVETPDSGEILTDAPEPRPEPPVLVSAVARQSGRFGDDLRLEVRAFDPDSDVTSIGLTVFTTSGEPLLVWDDDLDGSAESNHAVRMMDAAIPTAVEGDGVALLSAFVADHPALARLEVTAVDATGLASAPLAVDLTSQPIVGMDGLCDPTFVMNRCEDGLGCRGDVPAVCVSGAPPSITRGVYYGDPGAVRVMVEGMDPDDDVTEIVISFFDGEGAAHALDLDGDGTPESDHFTADVRGASAAGAFFYAFPSSDAFAAEVASVGIVVRDRGERASDELHTAQTLAPVRTMGAECDPRGFDVCGASVCAPGVVGETNRCIDVRVARTAECGAAETLDAFLGGSLAGLAAGPSLWDAPSGCSSGDPTARPEGVVRLHVDHDAARIVLSTANAYTTFDTTLYVIADCAAAPVVAWCTDDIAGKERSWLSRLELTSVPAGDYLVLVDSFSPAGGRFQLDVTAE